MILIHFQEKARSKAICGVRKPQRLATEWHNVTCPACLIAGKSINGKKALL